ncbi:AraC family transcriptional regulator [Metapseudomonas otitidis]|uniref:AraC family transcriptional regulator n=1 Tax=Metapseudomonas otitidis TaxID=319939 RepID=UPI0013F5A0E9|nr:AraC family transcriptional regulator [Pseudomonas otitidis]
MSPTRVSALAVLDLHDLLLQLGAVDAAQLQAAGLSREGLLAGCDPLRPLPEQRLDESLLLGLWQQAASHPALPHVGLLVGLAFNPERRGLLASLLFQCASVGEALSTFLRHGALMNPSEQWQAHDTGDGLCLELAFAAGRGYPQAAVERSLVALVRWGRELAGDGFVPDRVEFACPRPAYAERFVDAFGIAPQFGCAANRVYLSAGQVASPIRSANPYLKALLEARVQEAQEQLRAETDLVERVRLLIRADLASGPGVDALCAHLHLSRPTLYRRLREQGTGFAELLEEERSRVALQQAREGVPVQTISEALGFKDVSTFHRAFRRWFGHSPGAARQVRSMD